MIRLDADFCVVGGGIAGVCAALAAARNGARVVLVQDRSVLGGNASSEVRMHMVGASCSGKRPGAREAGIVDELRVEDAVRNPHRSPHLFDLLLYDKVMSEPAITLLLDTACTGCRIAGGRIESVRATRHSTEDEFEIRAAQFADCSGDGRLGAEAGAAFRMGRESRDEFGEPLAPEIADGDKLGSTILFTARRHDRPMPFTAPSWARPFTERDLRYRSHAELDYGYWWVEWGGHLDTIKDNDRIRHELLRVALGVWDHVKNHCPRRGMQAATYDKASEGDELVFEDPANWALEWVGMIPGKRESRRFTARHMLTQHDVQSGCIFEDQVAYGGWWIDMHPVMGVDAPGEYPCAQAPVPHLYSIPLRSLRARDLDNLFFAGRIIGATHVAFASTRVMATCGVVGQAVGTAAALASRGPLDIVELRRRLSRDGAYLIGAANDDPADLARQARIAASSGDPGAVTNGVDRATSPRLHPSLPDSSNQWTSDTLPAWIELRWEEPREISTAILTFDTGFHRELTLTMSDAYAAKMIRGPQPETVRDYRLSAGGREIAVTGNYSGRRLHRFDPPVRAASLRLDVTAVNGDTVARVFGVRVYGPPE